MEASAFKQDTLLTDLILPQVKESHYGFPSLIFFQPYYKSLILSYQPLTAPADTSFLIYLKIKGYAHRIGIMDIKI